MIERARLIQELTSSLMDELRTIRTSGCALAENEAEYRKALRLAILEEREKGTPVSIISDVCRGREDIASLKTLRDCSETVYKASQEAVNVYKLRIRVLQEEMRMDWNSGGFDD